MPQFDHAASFDFFRRSMSTKSYTSASPNSLKVHKAHYNALYLRRKVAKLASCHSASELIARATSLAREIQTAQREDTMTESSAARLDSKQATDTNAIPPFQPVLDVGTRGFTVRAAASLLAFAVATSAAKLKGTPT
jgi:hypothetical protein